METNEKKGFLKRLYGIERNATWMGQIWGLICFFICWKVVTVVVILGSLILGDSTADLLSLLGNILGIILGIFVYYKIISRYQKNK